jgi:hypothetical protein
MKHLRLLLISFAIGFSSSAMAVDATIKGATECAEWTDNRANNSELSDEIWLTGFLSGVARATNNDFLRYVDGTSIYLWMDNYCKIHPADDMATGAMAFYKEQKDIKRKKDQ